MSICADRSRPALQRRAYHILLFPPFIHIIEVLVRRRLPECHRGAVLHRDAHRVLLPFEQEERPHHCRLLHGPDALPLLHGCLLRRARWKPLPLLLRHLLDADAR